MKARRVVFAIALPALSSFFPIVSTAATYLVRPDGTGDFPNIQAAVDAASDGDVVMLADGWFMGEGNWDIDFLGKGITIRSESGDPATCWIKRPEFEGDHRAFLLHNYEGPDSRIEGIRISDFRHETGGAMTLYNYASPVVKNCEFSANHAGHGGAVYSFLHAAPAFEDCRFTGNSADADGGAIYGGVAALTRCTFERNQARTGGACFIGNATVSDCRFVENQMGALLMGGGEVVRCMFERNKGDMGGAAGFGAGSTVRDCVFWRNEANSGGAASIGGPGSLIDHCTFAGNTASSWGSALLVQGPDVVVENTILAFGIGDQPLRCADGAGIDVRCSDVFGDYAGDWIDCLAGLLGVNGNIAADPLFCDRAASDFSLRGNSPCAPGNNQECGRIGAREVGCDNPVGTRAMTWGQIRSVFR